MTMLINWKVSLYIGKQFNHELWKFLRWTCHLSTSKGLMRQNCSHELGINRQQFIRRWVFNKCNSDIGCEPCRYLMSTYGCWWIHRCYNLNSLKTNEFQVIIIKAFVANYLLQERYQLNCVVLIWFRQIDIFHVDN